MQLVQHPVYYPSEVWTLEAGELDGSVDEIIEDLRKITTLDGALAVPAMNTITAREGQTNWGASGSLGEYILQVSSNLGGGVGSVAAVAAIKAALQRIKQRSRDDSLIGELTADQARSLVKSHIYLHYRVLADDLTEKYSSISMEAMEFSFTDPSGVEYGGATGAIMGVPRCTRVWRKGEIVTMPEFLDPED